MIDEKKEGWIDKENFLKLIFSSKTVNDISFNNSPLNKIMRSKINLILNDNKIQEDNFEYKSGQFFYIINNLILLFSFMFINFFVYFTVIPLNNFELKKLLIDKENVSEFKYDKINEYILEKLKKFNSKFDEENFIACCYSYIFDPIKYSKKKKLLIF